MDAQNITIEEGFSGRGYVIPSGPVNLVCVVTDYGIAACGLVDVHVYDSFGIPAVCARKASGTIHTVEELRAAPVVKVNSCAACMGVKTGKSASETLSQMRSLVRKSRSKSA